jgi:hypothetical protein
MWLRPSPHRSQVVLWWMLSTSVGTSGGAVERRSTVDMQNLQKDAVAAAQYLGYTLPASLSPSADCR